MLQKSILWMALACVSFGPVIAADMNGHTAGSMNSAVSDATITTKVKSAFLRSAVLKKTKISVATTNHEVNLSGTLATDQEYGEAVTLADSIDGVTNVNADNLKVTASSSPIHDTYITGMVKGSFIREKLFGDKEIAVWPVSVETKDGVVYLTGEVDTTQERDNALSIAQKVPNVKSVNSTITVKAN